MRHAIEIPRERYEVFERYWKVQIYADLNAIARAKNHERDNNLRVLLLFETTNLQTNVIESVGW